MIAIDLSADVRNGIVVVDDVIEVVGGDRQGTYYDLAALKETLVEAPAA